MFDWVTGFHYTRFHRFYRNPDAWITGPHAETVALWDRLCQSRRVVAVGGVDVHARRYPLVPFVVFPYRDVFCTVRTHVLTSEPLTGDAPARHWHARQKRPPEHDNASWVKSPPGSWPAMN